MQLEGRVKQALLWNMQHQKELLLYKCKTIHKGDIVVYHRTDWQQRQDALQTAHAQYTSEWSLPQLVTTVHDNSVIERELYKPQAKTRQVPLRLSRKLTSLKEGLTSEGPPISSASELC